MTARNPNDRKRPGRKMPPPVPQVRYFGWSALSIETGDGALFFDRSFRP